MYCLQVDSADEVLGPILTWIFIIVPVIQGILSMAGNLVTIIVVVQYEFLRDNSVCWMVAGLAFADLCGGMIPFPGLLARHFISSLSALNVLCYVRVILNLITMGGNVYCTLLCTVDRCIFTFVPLRYHAIVTPKRATWTVLIAWALLVLQIGLMMGLAPSYDATISCAMAKVISKPALYVSMAQFFLITFCVIVPIYGAIGYESWQLSKNEPHISNLPVEARAAQKKKLGERKMVKTIGLVLGTYLICYTPQLVCDLIFQFSFKKPFPFGILLTKRILTVVYCMQGILNPFIYSWKNVHFRKAYNKMMPQPFKPVIPALY